MSDPLTVGGYLNCPGAANEGDDMSNEGRCRSRCQVVAGQWKYCIRVVDHRERHLWVESLDRSCGQPQLMVWDEDDAEQPAVVGAITIQEIPDVEDEA